MAKAKRDVTLDWREVNPDTLPPQVAKAYKAYKAKYAEAKALKGVFEQEMLKVAGLPATHTLRFGYNFGKLSCAVDVATAQSSASGKAVTLSDYLKSIAA